jgi:hypothetical protein
MTIHIIQNGSDGFGHQLEGLFNCIIIHNVENYYFDGISYIEKNFNFEHVNNTTQQILKEYLINVIRQFIKDNNLNKIYYTNNIHSHEITNIPNNYENNVLYSLDNIFFFKCVFQDLVSIQKINENINIMKSYFINDLLPANRLDNNNIVIHVRLGDALASERGELISRYNEQILDLIDILKIKYPDHKYYIHSDGEPSQILNKIENNYIFYNKNTPILQTLSDFIHAKIFICGISSLSLVCSYLGNKELIIVNDNENHSLPDYNVYKISDYIQTQP